MLTKLSLIDNLSEERLKEILCHCSSQKVGVIGDLALDAYWHADMTRSLLSRETPLFPRPVVQEVYAPGAGANVAQNLKMLGVDSVLVFSVIGDDWRGEILKKEMVNRNINIERILVSPQRTTTTYVKPILMGFNSQQEDARIDFENTELLSSIMEERLLDLVTQQLPGLDALIIVDQLDMNGIITERVRESLNNLAANYSDKYIAVDSRQHIGLFRNIILKPNMLEALASIYSDYDLHTLNREELLETGKNLSQQSNRPVFITLGDEGVLICDKDAHRYLPSAPVTPPLDPVGAGDTFLAALTVALASGATPWEAGTFANLAAAITVEKLNQTGTAAPQEILERFGTTQAREKQNEAGA